MIRTAVFYDENGKVGRIRTGPTANVEADVEASGGTCLYFDDVPDTENKYVQDGVLVSMPEQPSPHHEFNYATKAWDLNLAHAKQDKWREIKVARENDEVDTFTWDSKVFQCDYKSQQRLLGMVQRAQIDSSLQSEWTLSDNSVVTFSAADYIDIGKALMEHIDSCHIKARGLRADIEAATTLEAVNGVSW